MNQESKNKKIIMSLIGLMVLIGAVIGGFAFNELLNADAKDRLVAKISSYQIKEMNDRMNSVVEEWKEQGIFKLSKKELINELREIESSAKEAKEELVSAETFLGEYRVEGAKYSKMPSYPSYEALLAKFETSMNNKYFKAMKEDKEKVAEGLEILKKEEEEERERVEVEERRKTEELAEAKKKVKEEKRRAEELKRKKEEKEAEEVGDYCSQLTREALSDYAYAVSTGETWRIDRYYKVGSKTHQGVVSLIEGFYNKGYRLSLNYCNIIDYKYDGNICKVHTDESFYNYGTGKTILQEMVYHWKYIDDEWRMTGSVTYDINSY